MYVHSTVKNHMKKLTQSSCHVVGRTVTGMPDQLSFRMASEEGNDSNTVLNKNVHAKCLCTSLLHKVQRHGDPEWLAHRTSDLEVGRLSLALPSRCYFSQES